MQEFLDEASNRRHISDGDNKTLPELGFDVHVRGQYSVLVQATVAFEWEQEQRIEIVIEPHHLSVTNGFFTPPLFHFIYVSKSNLMLSYKTSQKEQLI